MGVKNILGSIFAGGASNLVSSVGGVLDNLITNKEELAKLKLEAEKEIHRNLEAIQEQSLRETEAYLKDVQSARDREIQIAISDKAPLINKVITPVLALGVVLLTFIMWYAVLYKQFTNDNKDVVLFVLGSLSAICGQIISYYYGSSTGSKAKQDIIEKMSK